MKTGVLNSIVIENPTLLFEFVEDIRRQIQNENGKTVLSFHNELLIMNKSVELITDVYGIDINSRRCIGRLVDFLCEKSIDEIHYSDTMQLLSQMSSYISELTWDLDCEIECLDILPKQLLKAANLSVVEDGHTLAERIFQYIQFICQFFGEKVFIFVNARGYIPQNEFIALAATIVSHDYRCLFVDNKEYPLVCDENRRIIDMDLCEI